MIMLMTIEVVIMAIFLWLSMGFVVLSGAVFVVAVVVVDKRVDYNCCDCVC